jgi:Ca-activated chloride channel family protein
MSEDKRATADLARNSRSALLLLVVFLQISSVVELASVFAQDTSPGHVISQEVRLVVLPVTVRDRRGQFLTGLSVSNFTVFEDGRPQQITMFRDTDVPVTVGLVVDHSGSMITKRDEVIEGAVAFVQASNPQDREFVVNFGETVSFGLPANVAFTSNTEDLKAALSVPSAAGKTAMYDALVAALEHVQSDHLDKRAIILISDGGDNVSTHSFNQVLRTAQAANVVIYAIGLLDPLDADQDPRVLKQLASVTGGQVYFPNSGEEVVTVCRGIAADIRHQYTLGYSPPDAGRGGFRKIRVNVRAPGRGKLSVRTRTGYFLPESPSNGAAGKSAQGEQ